MAISGLPQSSGYSFRRISEQIPKLVESLGVPYDSTEIESDVSSLEDSILELSDQITELETDLQYHVDEIYETILDNEERDELTFRYVESLIGGVGLYDYTGSTNFGAFSSGVASTLDLGAFSSTPTSRLPIEFFIPISLYIDLGGFV